MLNIKYDNLVLFTYAIYPLRIATLDRLHDSHDELTICENFIQEGFIKRNEYGGVRLSDTGCDMLNDIFNQNRDALIQLLNIKKDKLNVKSIADTLQFNDSKQYNFWIGFFLKRLKNEGYISDFSISDNGICSWYYD